jgi:hypothetical protein
MEAFMKSFSDKQLKAYFLGKLPLEETENLEEKCAASEELTGQAQTVERELIDDYLRGNLSATDAELFEKNYPQTEARQHRFRAAKILWKVAAAAQKQSDAPPAQIPAKPLWKTAFSNLNGFWLAFGSLVLLLIFGAIALYMPYSAVNRNDVAEIKDETQPPKENPAVQNSDNQTTENRTVENPKAVQTNPVIQNKDDDKNPNIAEKNPAETKTVSSPKVPKQNKSDFAAFVLVSGTLRDEGEQSIKIAPDVKNVNLLLSPSATPDNYKIRRAVVKTAEGDTIFTSPNLKALSFKISADKLEQRTYIVFLEGQNARGEFESISEYVFRVRR